MQRLPPASTRSDPLVPYPTLFRPLARVRERGDAKARAIWLFSRNDAINNVAVIIAACLVYWLNSAWPDLVVAAVIAAIFLHSAWEIIRHARAELKEHALRI